MTIAPAHLERPRSDRARHPLRWPLHQLRWLGRWVLRRFWDIRVHHPERFPGQGPVVVAANHIGFLDGPVMAIFSPRPVHALTKIEMFRGLLRPALHISGQVPLDRFHVDTAAVRISLRVLREGGVVGVFPEGRRGSGELERFHRGAAYLAMVTGATIVPMTFIGTRVPGGDMESVPPRGARIDVVVGEPMAVSAVPWPRRKDEVAALSLALRDHMLRGLWAALAETGRSLPGPLPPGQTEPDPGDDVTERSA